MNFYIASNPLTSSDGERVDICKTCVKQQSMNRDGTIDVDKFKNMLMFMDKPFVPSALESAISEANNAFTKGIGRIDIIGNYMKNVSSLPQFRRLGFVESIEKQKSSGIPAFASKDTVAASPVPEVVHSDGNSKKIWNPNQVINKAVDDFVLTEEIFDRFGDGFSKSDYYKMQKKYDKIKMNYQISTNLHEEALATYVRFKIKEEQATASGDVASAEKWNKAAQEAADKAKLTPKQLTQSDLQGGITAISEISKAVEETTDIVEMLPRFKYHPNDAPDFIIWCYINFCRKLKGLPEVEYKDIYSFYDKKKAEYIAQYGDPYGIFDGDTTEKNRQTVEKFIQLPKDYNDGGDE